MPGAENPPEAQVCVKLCTNLITFEIFRNESETEIKFYDFYKREGGDVGGSH